MSAAETAVALPAGGRVAGRLQTVLVLAITAVAIGVAAMALGTGGLGQSEGVTQVELTGDTTGAAPVVGAIPPTFTATTYDGKPISLASYAGKPLWLTFGASWCPDCRAEAPDVEAAYRKYAPQGLNVVGVFISESASDIAGYAGRVGFTFPIAVDQSTAIASRFRTMGIPTHFFIGADGVIRDIRVGALDPATIETEIQAILGK